MKHENPEKTGIGLIVKQGWMTRKWLNERLKNQNKDAKRNLERKKKGTEGCKTTRENKR